MLFENYRTGTRTLCETLSEEEENKLQINAFFSPSQDDDFDEDVEGNLVTLKSKRKKPATLITEDEMNAICSIHSELARNFTYTDWIHPSLQSEDTVLSNIVQSFCDRFSVFVAILNKYSATLDEVMDVISLPSSLLMADVAQKFDITDEIADFYHTCDAEQVSLFYPVLIRIRDHAVSLQSQYEHPDLKKVCCC